LTRLMVATCISVFEAQRPAIVDGAGQLASDRTRS
jgi:hypothetical protein